MGLASRSCTTLLLAACALCGSVAPSRAADVVGEPDLKAAYIFNFIQFIEWPDHGGAGADAWVLCVSPFSPLKRSLIALDGRPARSGQPIRVKLLQLGELAQCRVAVLHTSDAEAMLAALRALPPDHGVLTVADGGPVDDSDVMITLFQQDGRIAFGVRTEATARAGLKVSSRLLRLAKAGK